MPSFCFYRLPGLGWFRAPARYTLLTSLGLALLAGRGFDHAIAARRFWTGLILAILSARSRGAGRSISHRARISGPAWERIRSMPDLSSRAVVWALGLLAITCWRQNLVGPWAPILLTALELGGLFFTGPVSWRWMVRLPEASPLLRHLAALPDVGLVGGRLLNLPVIAG